LTNPLKFNGVIRNVSYDSRIRFKPLNTYTLDEFNINKSAPIGIIDFGDNTSVGYARWTSPKRTRTYPLPRVYSVYHLPKKVAIIPIIKDEGYQTNNDRINYITYSWMNLSNVYIILAWYENASKHSSKQGRITGQMLNADFVNDRLAELRTYQQTALHWNTMHFERDFEFVYRSAVTSYENIAQKTNAVIVSSAIHLAELNRYINNGIFSLEYFKAVSLPKSYAASQRETQTSHIFEYLQETNKAYFFITNWLGGEYHLTSDEILFEDNTVIIQESKNVTGAKLPKLSDIQDGLFKLILFSNMDTLILNSQPVEFRVRLKLTGKLIGKLMLPADENTIDAYAKQNQLKPSERAVILKLNEEVMANPKLEIELNQNA
jgi:hypothetical protein